ncbi:aldehyde dehydrogenase family protein [Patulibacter defluvii]|uniref:aldehyde dehydrogenase family protein n=1 Tax=Patulibacter defluvii TaxID=3095358 RepID=UPI002A75C53B|nr:aldehyde dehydrogenase family protein [Patulibacter sp. DM4]
MPAITYATVYSESGSDADGLAFEEALRGLRQRDPLTLAHRIGGVEVGDGVRFERTDPVDPARVVASAPAADAATVARAVAAARAAQPAWGRRDYVERARLLQRVREAIADQRIPLAALASLETGKTRADALAEVDECVAIVDLFARQAEQSHGYAVPHVAPSAGSRAEVVLRPFGVFGVIAPFNFPLAIPFAMVAAALAAGNAVVFKPSALTPACGAAFVALFDRLELPEGLLNLVHGDGETGAALSEAEIDGLAFTGSAAVGLDLLARLHRPPYARPVIAEMGGKNPGIVTASADLAVAAKAVARSAFGMSGQKCNACSRAVVVDAVHDEFVERLRAEAEALVVGDPLDRAAFTGPVVGRPSVERFSRAVAAARADGRVVTGGGTGEGGHFVDLTVVDGLPAGHELTREELFLPVLSVVRVPDLDAALREANAVRYGLAAGVFSEDEGERARFLDEIEAGIVFVNNPGGATTGVWPGSQTMSGWKASGSTGKGGFGPWYLQQFSREQSRTVFA